MGFILIDGCSNCRTKRIDKIMKIEIEKRKKGLRKLMADWNGVVVVVK